MSPINYSQLYIVRAYVSGKTVQFKDPTNFADGVYDPEVWYDLLEYNDPTDLARLSNEFYEYRIKPE